MNNIRTLLTLIPALALLSSCAGPGYQFTMDQPEPQAVNTHADEDLKASFIFNGNVLVPDPGKDLEVTLEKAYMAYNGIEIKLKNRAKETLRIDWNRARFTDHNGNPDLPVMIRGTKPADCAGDKPASTLRPGETVWVFVIPCYAVNDREEWSYSLFPDPKEAPEIHFALSLPVSIGDREKTYDFGFSARQGAPVDADNPL